MKKQTLYPDELIGQKVTLVACLDEDLVGTQLCVVDETKHLLCFETPKGIKRLAKHTLMLRLASGVELSGTQLFARSEDRIKG